METYCEICFDARRKTNMIQCYPDWEEERMFACPDCAEYKYPNHIILYSDKEYLKSKEKGGED